MKKLSIIIYLFSPIKKSYNDTTNLEVWYVTLLVLGFLYIDVSPVEMNNIGNINIVHTDYLVTPRYLMDSSNKNFGTKIKE